MAQCNYNYIKTTQCNCNYIKIIYNYINLITIEILRFRDIIRDRTFIGNLYIKMI